MATTAFKNLPIIDLSPAFADRTKSGVLTARIDLDASSPAIMTLAAKVCSVFETVGFAYLANSNFSLAMQQAHFDAARQFFALDDETKMRLATTRFRRQNVNSYRGYFPVQEGEPSHKEGFEHGPDMPALPPLPASQQNFKINFTEANVWPSEASLPGFRATLVRHHAQLMILGDVMMQLFALGLKKPVDFFRAHFADSPSTSRLIHYPDMGPGDASQLSCSAHTDSGILTLLQQDNTGGLEVLNSAGEWIAAPPVEGALVVNIGDLLTRWTRGRFVATVHRVRRMEGVHRLSAPFFFEPGYAARVGVLDEGGAAAESGQEGVLYGDYLRKKIMEFAEYQDQDGNAETKPRGVLMM